MQYPIFGYCTGFYVVPGTGTTCSTPNGCYSWCYTRFYVLPQIGTMCSTLNGYYNWYYVGYYELQRVLCPVLCRVLYGIVGCNSSA